MRPDSSKVTGTTRSTKPPKVLRAHNGQPAIIDQKSEVREHSNPPEVSPTVSFGVTGSVLKNLKNVSLPNGDIYEGELNSSGSYHGYGKYVYANKNLEYQGQF